MTCTDTSYIRKDRGGTMPERFWAGYPCPHPAKYRVVTHGAPDGFVVCGVHVRQYRRGPLGLTRIEAIP